MKKTSYKGFSITHLKKGVFVVRNDSGIPVFNAGGLSDAKSYIDKNRRVYTSAPLPFRGQKRRFLRHFKHVIAKLPDKSTIVDLFGGSGILSNAAKSVKPNSRVIYNDFDCYSWRINQIERTNIILRKIGKMLSPVEPTKKVPKILHDEIVGYVKFENSIEPVDIYTIASSVSYCGSNKYFDIKGLEKMVFYNNVVKKGYNADGYLDGLEIVKTDYKLLFDKHKDDNNVFFIFDPPYLSTGVTPYCMYWGLKDYLDVIAKVKEASRFVYFSSSKSMIVELFNMIERISGFPSPFTDCEELTIKSSMNFNSFYEDKMLYKL